MPAITSGAVIGIIVAVVLCIGGGMVGCPIYSVWSAQKLGEAELARAEQNRQISIAQSKAKAEAAQYEMAAEVTRARGVAQANQIIGDSLKGEAGESYLRYLWVNAMENKTDKTVIYIPTEANLPILEAGRPVRK